MIPDGMAESDSEYAYLVFKSVMTLKQLIWRVVTLNETDYWRGWFFYNDMEDGDDACPVEVNTEEHLDLHWESNSGGGHYDCMRYEHIVNGRYCNYTCV